MKCGKCKQGLEGWQKFCPNCGAAAPRRTGVWIVVIVLLAVMAGLLGYRIYMLRRPVEQAAVQVLPAQPSPPAELPPAPPAAPAPAPSEQPAPPAAPAPGNRAPEKPVRKSERTTPLEPRRSSRPSLPPPAAAPPPEPAPATPPPAETPAPKSSPAPRPRVEIFRPDPLETPPPAPKTAPSRTATEPAPAPTSAPAPPAYQGPSAGTLIWSGQIEKDTLVRIEGDRVSPGRLTGELPGVPVRIEFEGAAFAIVEGPGPANNYKRLYLRSLKRIRSAVVIKWSLR